MPESQLASSLPAEAAAFARDYRTLPDRHDEMCTADGTLRPHWEYLIRALEALGVAECERRRDEARRLLHENGVTYNVYDDPGSERLWPLDPIPVLIPSQEWSAIEQGLIQRAELLDLLLDDLYGPRKLIAAGKLPAELIAGHPGFLRPCAGISTIGTRRLTVYAADLARAADGAISVIGDRAQAPSGSGYALENRVVLSRILPSLYRDSHVHRLALFFRALRGTLQGLDPHRRGDPRIVVLTPGSENETFFEHAYLANYLGYDLVHGSDLTVRDEHVWLKALDGLKPVDVILRRLDDGYCDPLELRADSLLGAPGLLQAVRAGNVAIANPLGSGVLENPGLMACLPGLARELLGEDLRLRSVPTWWCGDVESRAYVLEHLDELVIKPIFPHPSASTVFGARSSRADCAAIAERIRARPHLFVGQEQIALSSAPVLIDGRLEPRPMVMRAFAAAVEQGYVVMPGALGRVAPSADSWIVSNQHGGVSKDVWVLASEPERLVSLLAPSPQLLAVRRDGDDVPGRVADDLFWLGRYSERTEGTARLLREALQRVLAAESAVPDEGLAALLAAVTALTGTFPGFIGEDAEERLRNPEAELLHVVLDRRCAGSLRFDIEAVVRAGRSVRDRLSSDASRVINSLNREFNRPCESSAALEGLQRLIIQLAAFAGLCGESMSRGQGWRFLEIGRGLERAVYTVGLLRALFAVENPTALEALLAVAHSVKTYRRRYRSRVQPPAVLDLLLLDETNPRSVGYQLMQLEKLIAELENLETPRRSAPQRTALDALTQLRLFDMQVVGSGGPAAAEALAALLQRLAALLAGLSDEIAARYFSHAESPQQLVRLL